MEVGVLWFGAASLGKDQEGCIVLIKRWIDLSIVRFWRMPSYEAFRILVCTKVTFFSSRIMIPSIHPRLQRLGFKIIASRFSSGQLNQLI
jgi:hypothetical protein